MDSKIWDLITTNRIELIKFFGSIVAIILALYQLYKKGNVLSKRFNKWLDKINSTAAKVDNIEKFVLPNGGKSINDAVVRVENKIDIITSRQDANFNLNELPMFECDEFGECINANDSLCKLFGASKNQMLGNGWLHYLVDSERQKKVWLDAVESDNEITSNYTINYGLSGTLIEAKYMAHIRRDNNDKVINVTGKVIKI